MRRNSEEVTSKISARWNAAGTGRKVSKVQSLSIQVPNAAEFPEYVAVTRMFQVLSLTLPLRSTFPPFEGSAPVLESLNFINNGNFEVRTVYTVD